MISFMCVLKMITLFIAPRGWMRFSFQPYHQRASYSIEVLLCKNSAESEINYCDFNMLLHYMTSFFRVSLLKVVLV